MSDNTNSHLEAISEKIRRGEPVRFEDAIAAIDYQTALKAERDRRRRKPLWQIFLAHFLGEKP